MSARRPLQVISTIASIFLLIWLLTAIGWPTVVGALSKVGFGSAAALLGLAFTESAADSLALRVVTGPTLRVGTALGINAAGAMLNLVLPWESGEILKGGLLNGEVGASKGVSSTVIWNYIFKLSRPLVSLAAALLAVALCREISNTLRVLIVLANVLAFLPYLAFRFAFRWGATVRLVRLLQVTPLIRKATAGWGTVAQSVDEQVRSFSKAHPVPFSKVVLLQIVARCTGWLSVYFGFQAVGLPYGIAEAMLIYATMNVAEYLITLLPARVGVGEGTAFGVFQLFGLNGPLGLVLYTLLRIRTILVNGLLAFLALDQRNRATPREPAQAPTA